MHFSHSAPPINSFREMPCFLLWLSGGLHALLICAFVWGHLPFSGPFRNRVSLSTWYYSLRDCTWEAYCVIGCAWSLHMSICLKLVGSLRLPGFQSEVQLSHPSRCEKEGRGEKKRVPGFPSVLPAGALHPQQQQQL